MNMSSFGLIGTITSDHITVDERPAIHGLGGILYQAAVLCGLGEDVHLFANCGEVSRRDAEETMAGWPTLRRDGLTFVPGPGNQVHLRYAERLKEREEVLESVVPPLDAAPILAGLPEFDALLMVFNSGFELELADWRRIVDAARRCAYPIWLDVHSFVLARLVGAHRDYVAVPDWPRWMAGITYLQANRQEVASLRGHPDRWPTAEEIEDFAAAAFAIGVRAVLVTMGKDGVLILTEEGGGPRQVAAPTADRVVDTTGCGDVFAASTLRLLARGMPLIEAASAGVDLASKAVGLAGIAETYRLARNSARGVRS
jgi:hypothetical protein